MTVFRDVTIEVHCSLAWVRRHASNSSDGGAGGNRQVQVSPGTPGTLCRAICVAQLGP